MIPSHSCFSCFSTALQNEGAYKVYPSMLKFFFPTKYLKSGKFTSKYEFSNSLEKITLSDYTRLAHFTATVNWSWVACNCSPGLWIWQAALVPTTPYCAVLLVLRFMLAAYPLWTFSLRIRGKVISQRRGCVRREPAIHRAEWCIQPSRREAE